MQDTHPAQETNDVRTLLHTQVRQALLHSTHLDAHSEISIRFSGPLSNLPPCTAQWQVEFSPGNPKPGRTTAHLLCPDQPIQRWIEVFIGVKSPVVVVKTPIRSHDNIPIENLSIELEDITWLQGNYFSDPHLVAGSTARRDLSMGTILGPQDIAPPLLIHRGDQIIIEATAGNLTVSDVGIALNDAARGESVRIQHQKSGKIVQGYAIDHDVARVAL